MARSMISHLVAEAKFTVVVTVQGDGQATVSSDILDMAGFDSILFIAQFADVDTTSVLTLTAQQDIANAGGGMATLTGSATFEAGATDADDDVLILDIHRPRDRYVRCQVVIATANAVLASVIAVQYNAHTLPVTQSSTVLDSAMLSTPAE